MPAEPIAQGITQIAIPCEDVPRAALFYKSALGIPFLFESNGLAFLQCGNVRLMLSPAGERRLGVRASTIYFSTDDIEKATKSLEARGTAVDAQPHMIARLPDREVWISAWRDSENNQMCFMQEKAIGVR